MQRCVLVFTTVLSLTAYASDYRDCKELFIYPTASVIPATKPGGMEWDNGSSADVSITAKPSGRPDLPPKVIAPKEQDARTTIAWETVWPSESKHGLWFPMRIGDSLDLVVVDKDAFQDDRIASGSFEIPKNLTTTGFGIFPVTLDGTVVFLAVSATDGKRLCSGVDGDPADVKIAVPTDVIARPDGDAFAAIAAHNKCNLNGGTPACKIDSYTAAYDDANNDGTPDVIVAGGPFVRGSTSKVVALWLGVEPASRKQVFVGDCDDVGLLSKTEFTCTASGKTTVVSYAGSGSVREASASEVSKSQAVTAEARSVEAKANLKSLYTAQKTFFLEKNKYSTNMKEIGFEPARGNRYAYFAAPRGDVQTRSSAVLPSLTMFSIVAPDENAHPGIAVPKGLKEASCPLTFGTSPDGEPLGLGVTGEPPSQEFVGYAIGNVDDDEALDCWSIATFDRKAKSGAKIPAGEPWHESSDFAEQKATASTGAP